MYSQKSKTFYWEFVFCQRGITMKIEMLYGKRGKIILFLIMMITGRHIYLDVSFVIVFNIEMTQLQFSITLHVISYFCITFYFTSERVCL